MANYNVDIDVAVNGYNRVEQNLKKLDKLIGKPRVIDINPGIQFRKFRQEKLRLLQEMRRAGAESAVAFQKAFEREARIARQVAGAGSRTLSAAAGPIALLPAVAVGQFQKAANAAKMIDASFASAKRSIDSMTNQLLRALPGTVSGPGVRIAGLLPGAGGTGGSGGFGSFRAPEIPGPKGVSPRSPFIPVPPLGSSQINLPKNFNAAIASGAFPLLFGGGIGQAAGGFAGGFATGKMFSGLTISMQVAGAALDAFIADTAQTGKALAETGSAFQLMSERSLFSTKETQERAAKLEKLGEKEKLAALLTDELTQKIGSTGFDAMLDLGKETDKTTRLWNELTLQLQALIAGPLAELLSIIGSIIGNQVELNRLNALRTDLEGTDAGKRLEEEISQKTKGKTTEELLGGGKNAGFFENLATTILIGPDALMQKAEKTLTGDTSLELSGVLSDIPTDELKALSQKYGEFRPKPQNNIRLTPDMPKKQKGRESRVPELQVEVDLTERLNVLNRQILKAKQDEDPVREAALTREIALEKQASKIKKINLEKIPQEEKDLKIKELKLQTDQKIFETNHELSVSRAAQAEKNQEIIANFEDQNKLLQAQLNGRLDEEEIKQKLLKLAKENKGLDVEKVRDILEANDALKKQVEIAESIEAFYERIGSTIQSGIVDGIMGAVEGSRSLAESLSGILRQLGGMFLNVGVGALGQSMGIPGFKPYAQGGYVSGPTNALIGEGGEPEYVIPESKMRESMSRYSRGSRGSSVIPEVGGSGTSSGGGGLAVAAPIDVRYTVERINSVDYVTADQFQSGMQQAATQGAKQGEQQTLKRLQMSGSTRRRIGI